MPFLLIVIYITFISLGLPDSLFGVSWPVVHVEFGIAQSFASVYSIITGVCTGGVSFIAGTLIRKFGTGKVTFVSVLLTAIGMLGNSFAPNIVVMMLCSVIMGYGAGAIDTGLNNYVSLHYEARHMNWLHCFWGVGVTLSPIIMSQFLGGGTGVWRNGYRVVALIQFSIALLVLLTQRYWHKEAVISDSQDGSSTQMSTMQLLRIKGLGTSILSLGLYCSAEFLLGTWGASFAVEYFGIAPEEAARWVALYYGGIMLGRLVSGFVSIKATDNMLIRAGVLTSLAGIAVLMLPLGKTALCGFLLIGFGFGPIFPSVLHSVPARFGSTYSADITGFHMGGAYAIGFLIQLAFGYIATATTFAITQYVLLALCAGIFLANAHTVTVLKKANN